MNDKTYTQGMTIVWTDGDKVKVSNTSGIQHVEANVDNIFGMGEFKKLQALNYYEEYNKYSYREGYELLSGYIPARVRKDLDIPENLIDKYF